jgi:hypothetical protein
MIPRSGSARWRPIRNCGQIIIHKQTDPDWAAGSFVFTTTGGSTARRSQCRTTASCTFGTPTANGS